MPDPIPTAEDFARIGQLVDEACCEMRHVRQFAPPEPNMDTLTTVHQGGLVKQWVPRDALYRWIEQAQAAEEQVEYTRDLARRWKTTAVTSMLVAASAIAALAVAMLGGVE
jgi:hypothetical protein